MLPSNSPGVHTLWLPVIPMQIGLVLKPGPQEPWTPYRMAAAFSQAGIPPEAISIYPGGGDVGAAVLASCERSMIFGGTATVERYKGNPRVQAHGPGFSKILLGDDVVDDWEEYLDLMADSVYLNSGRGCINCSGIWASRHTQEIAEALAERLGPIEPYCRRKIRSPAWRRSRCPARRPAVWKAIDADLHEAGVETCHGSQYGPRLVEMERCGYLRPTVVHCESPAPADRQEGIHVPVRHGRQVPAGANARIDRSDAGLHGDHRTTKAFSRRLTDATHIDRLNIGPIPTIKLDWLQPHEGNIVEFLFRARAYQLPKDGWLADEMR